ncbi:MAG: hypothetical protein WCS51_05055 [Bacilli bacterium]
MRMFGKKISALFLSIMCVFCICIVPAYAATSIKLDTTKYTFSEIGKTYIFKATSGAKVTANSNNSNVAIVQPVSHKGNDYYFKITAKGIGCTKINAIANGTVSSILTTVGNTGSITSALPTYKINEPFTFKDKNGNSLYNLTINGIKLISDRNELLSKNPVQLFLIDYTYTNIAKNDGVSISSSDFNIVDSKGYVGYDYFPTTDMMIDGIGTNYPKKVSIGTSCNANMLLGVDNLSNKIILQFKNNMFESPVANFVLEVPQI